MHSLFDLAGRVAVVTRCNTGLGSGLAQALASAGCHIVGVNRTEPTATRAAAEALDRRFINIATDLNVNFGPERSGMRVSSCTGGLLGLTRLLSNEWARHGINVSAIAPGYMETNNTQALSADVDRNRAILDRIPAGRWGAPSDLAGAIIFLATAASDYVHGHTLAVDGGWLAR